MLTTLSLELPERWFRRSRFAVLFPTKRKLFVLIADELSSCGHNDMPQIQKSWLTVAAERGATWLDKNYAGWRTGINCDILDMALWGKSILGQLGIIDAGMQKKYSHKGWLMEHGFLLIPGIDRWFSDKLTQAWREIIKNV